MPEINVPVSPDPVVPNTQNDTAKELKPKTRVEHFLNKIANSISGEAGSKALTLYVEDGHAYKDKLCTETYASYAEACEALLAAGSNIRINHVEGDEGEFTFASGVNMDEETNKVDVYYIKNSSGELVWYTVCLYQNE